MHDVVARLESGQTLERSSRGVSAGTTKATFAPEDFVIGENAVAGERSSAGGNDEAAIQYANGKTGWRNPIIVQELIEPLGLTGVVAENRRRNSIRDDLLEPLHVALDLFGLPEWKKDLGVVAREVERAVLFQRAKSGFRSLEQLIAARCVFSPPSGKVDVVLGFRPGPFQLRLDVRPAGRDEDRIRRKERANGGSLGLGVTRCDLTIDWKHQCDRCVARRPLGEQIEVAQLCDVVTPELEADGLRHSEAVDVEDPAAHAELGDILDHFHALETDRGEMGGKLLGPSGVSLSQLEPGRGEGVRKLRALQESPTGGDDDPKIATTDSLECLDPFSGDFRVRLCFAEALARGVESDGLRLDEGAKIRQPPFGTRDVVVQHHEEAVRKILSECRDDYSVARPVQTSDSDAAGGSGKIGQQLLEFIERFEDRDQLWERHGAR